MMVTGLLMTVYPHEPWWNPHTPEGAECGLIGWVQDVAPVDSGVPSEVKQVLVNSLVRQYALLFVGEAAEKSSVWRALPDRWVRQAVPSGMLSRLLSSGFSIVSTVDT